MLFLLSALTFIDNLLSWGKVATADEFQLGSLLQDDGYYYLLIAENILAGKGVTFDGINPTSGFQPLYEALTLGLSFIAAHTHISIFRCIFFANLILVFLSAIVIGKTINKITKNPDPAVTYLLLALFLPLNFPLVFKRLAGGMEMALGLFLLSIFFHTTCSAKEHRMRYWVIVLQGVLLAAMTLTRLDFVIFAAFFGVFIASTSIHRIKSLLSFLLGYFLLISAYIIFAYLHFDSVVPVSLLAKQHYSSMRLAWLSGGAHLYEFARNMALVCAYPLGYALFGFYWGWKYVGLIVSVVASYVVWTPLNLS